MNYLADEFEFRAWALGQAAAKWSSCQGCSLADGRKRLIYGSGSPSADLLILGDGPGVDDDYVGSPFNGHPGALLRRVLSSRHVGIPEERVYFSNRVCCRPQDLSGRQRHPDRIEVDACEPRLRELVRILDPSVVLLLGTSAASWCGVERVTEGRGLIPPSSHPPDLGAPSLRAFVLTWHPNQILRVKGQKKAQAFREFVEDISLVKRLMDEPDREEPR